MSKNVLPFWNIPIIVQLEENGVWALIWNVLHCLSGRLLYLARYCLGTWWCKYTKRGGRTLLDGSEEVSWTILRYSLRWKCRRDSESNKWCPPKTRGRGAAAIAWCCMVRDRRILRVSFTRPGSSINGMFETISALIGSVRIWQFLVWFWLQHSYGNLREQTHICSLQVELLDVAELLPALEALATLRQHGSEETCRPDPLVREDENLETEEAKKEAILFRIFDILGQTLGSAPRSLKGLTESFIILRLVFPFHS